MAKIVKLVEPPGPNPKDLSKLSSYSNIPKSNINKKELQDLWEIITIVITTYTLPAIFCDKYDCDKFLFCEGDEIFH